MTEDQVRRLIERAVAEAGGQRAFCRLHKGKISVARVGQVLAGQPPGDDMCRLVGIERVTTVTYRHIKS